ncbi:phosphate ABC transporter substrate-binding protein PstS [Demequina sp. SYSU T00039]|uniref:Phosphate-binding protein n=1 Tax=Demequina lignilytica TaxID=3051663 RepID=A0AAW7M195_9MICO|nr:MULTISPECIES: phosphate ABC transporter substrate-binding protein PstS [unclassified Demequina]MDN4477485.1 phosphate ABC transporter substrate-binding protein PstS [Demequina sp. SYSU T00039-1]MDN4488164.1 phosphate ABC transporter substrate-binding protein PstS [Demequina sp. SYSU T00039]MDN4490605.1 phosphate ABC transporter substrate-binding protein PstS [Demequina sp. SYSU T00068]
MKIAARTGAVLTATALTFALAACSASNEGSTDTESSATETTDTAMELSGSLNGAGASSQESAMEAWRAGFQSANPDVTVNYDPVGSGGGRTQFLDGATSFAGSDAQMDEEEYDLSIARCDGESGAIHLPMYISPIAVIFNLDGIDSLNMDADTIADIFNGTITNWSDDAIASQNEGVELPDSAITIVHRADESGTTENFTEYLAAASTTWGQEASGDWMGAAGESGQGTSALVQIVQDNAGTIGYADASRAGDLGTVALKVGEEYVPFSAEAAAAVVDASPAADYTSGENDLAIHLDRTTTAAGAYPLVLVSYHIVCQQYDDATEAALVTGFLKYVASEEGQAQSASAAGSSPISADLSAKITAILDEIAAA